MAGTDLTREQVLASPPTSWDGGGRGRASWGLVVVVGVLLGSLFVGLGAGVDDVLDGTADGLILVLFPLVLVVGGGVALVQQLTWRSWVDDAEVLHAGGLLRRRRVDLGRLASVSLRPEGPKPDPRATVKLVVTDHDGGRVAVSLGWNRLSWEAWHLLAWHAIRAGVPLSGPVRLALSASDSPAMRQLLDVPSPPVTGAVRCRSGPRLILWTLYTKGIWAVVTGYGASLRGWPGEWPWWVWPLGILSAVLGLYALQAVVRRPGRRLTIDAAGRLEADGVEVDLGRLVLVDQGLSTTGEGVYFERLVHLRSTGMPEPTAVPMGIADLRVEDEDAHQVRIPLTDRWEPMAPLASRLLDAVERRGLTVSEHVAYNLRFAAGQVPLSEHRRVVEATTGVAVADVPW